MGDVTLVFDGRDVAFENFTALIKKLNLINDRHIKKTTSGQRTNPYGHPAMLRHGHTGGAMLFNFLGLDFDFVHFKRKCTKNYQFHIVSNQNGFENHDLTEGQSVKYAASDK
jgi:hypothetical protein